jgi:hypothetical protein
MADLSPVSNLSLKDAAGKNYGFGIQYLVFIFA